MPRLLISLFIIVVTASPAFAVSVRLAPDQQGLECIMAYDAPGVVNVYALLVYSPGATGAQFSAPLPECWTGVVHLSDYVPPPFISIGNSQTGIAIAFGICDVSPVHVLTMSVFASNPDLIGDCCVYEAQPDMSASVPGIYYTDCADPPNLLTASGGGFFITRSGAPEPPALSNPLPPDGALDQPLDVILEWTATLCSCGLGVLLHDVYFGSNPDPPLVSQHQDLSTFDPGTLQPETTYYWKIVALDTDAGSTTGPVWSFTTESAIPAEESSWGRIKNLFR